MEFVLATLTPGQYNYCTYTPSDLHNSEFEVIKLVPGGPERDAYDVRMLFNPGTPEENDHQYCPMLGEQDSGYYSLWAPEFLSLHEDEYANTSPAYFASEEWETIPYGNFVAKKLYDRVGLFGTEPALEATHIFLKHTPDAPLP